MAKMRLRRRVYHQLLRTFDVGRYRPIRETAEGKTYKQRSWYNFTGCELCPHDHYLKGQGYCTVDEAIDGQELCPYRELCGKIFQVLGDKVSWYGDCAMYQDKDYAEARVRLELAQKLIEDNCEPDTEYDDWT